jgi:hypothetical protein
LTIWRLTKPKKWYFVFLLRLSPCYNIILFYTKSIPFSFFRRKFSHTYWFLLIVLICFWSISASSGLNEEQQLYQKMASDFARNEMLPNMEKWDREVKTWPKFICCHKGNQIYTKYKDIFFLYNLASWKQLFLEKWNRDKKSIGAKAIK